MSEFEFENDLTLVEGPDEAADKLSQLGEPRAEFSVRGRRFFRNLIVAPLLVLLGLAIEFFMVVLFIMHRAHGHIHFVLVGVLMMVGGTTLLVRAYRNWGLRVLVFPEGVVCLHPRWSQTFFWDEVTALWEKKTAGHWARVWKGSLIFTVQRANGPEIHFDDSLPRLKELGEILHKETLPHLLPRTLAVYEAGDILPFGKLRLNLQGLSHDNETLLWRDVQGVTLTGHLLTVNKTGKWLTWYSVPVAEIPNVRVLQALVEHILKVRKSNKGKGQP
jgi:hypothetical protein